MNKVVNLQTAQACDSDRTRIQFEGERSRKFYHLLCQAFDANDALSTTAEHFPDPLTGPGIIDPSLAVDAYSGTVRDRLNQALAMISGDDIEADLVAQEPPAPEPASQQPDEVMRASLRDIYNRVTRTLRAVVQANCSMGAIAKTLSPEEYTDGEMCPELVIPLLVKSTSEALEQAYQVLEELEQLADHGMSGRHA